MQKFTTSIALLLTLTSGSAVAQDLFGRTEPIYDLTGSPQLENLQLDYDYINGRVPTYAEQQGLAGAPTVEVRSNFLYVEDSDGSLTIPWQNQRHIFESFNFAIEQAYQVFPDEFVFIYFFTAFQTGVGAFFYSPEANTTLGIGSERFDNNGFSVREGFVFMNYWKSFEEAFRGAPANVIRAQSRAVFNQEAGHRWGSFVTLDGPAEQDPLLGRDASHWSYFMESGASPLEGNSWRDEGGGSFITTTGVENWRFGQLDLYLMGLKPSTDVPNFFLIENPDVGNSQDIYGQPVTASSPPQIIQPVRVTGTRRDITIDDIISRNGLRRPTPGDAPSRWRVLFVMLAGQSTPLSESDKDEFGEMVELYASGFQIATENIGSLDYVLAEEVPKSPIGGPCGDANECIAAEATLCLAPPTPGLCTRPCLDETSCPGDWCCQAPQGQAGAVCLPMAMCEPEPPVCECDVNLDTCDEGCACDVMCTPGGECNCDATTACDADCVCDPECDTTPEFCACDVTYSCDANDDNTGDCGCDPECGLAQDEGGSCSCSETNTTHKDLAPLVLITVIGLFLRRRRRR